MQKYDSDFYSHVNADGYLRRLIESQGLQIKYCQTEEIIYKSDYILRKYFYFFTVHIMIINDKILLRKLNFLEIKLFNSDV